MRLSRRLIAVLLPFCLLSLACSNLQKPTATFQTMSLGEVTADGFTMNFDVEMHNPNAIPLPISTADYKLGLAGVNVLEGKATPEATLPANGSAAVTLPVTLTWENLLAAEKALRTSSGDIPYAFDASIDFGSASGGINTLGQPLRVPLKYKGTLPLGQLLEDPSILMNSPAARKIAQKILGGFFGG